MFDSLKSLGAIASLMKNKDQLEAAARRLMQELASRRITVEGATQPDGQSGVTVVVTGKLEVESISLSKSLLASASSSPEAHAKVQQLIANAVNAALKRAKEILMAEVSSEMKKLGLPELPGLDKLLGN